VISSFQVFLRKFCVHFSFHSYVLLDPNLSHLNPVQALTYYLFRIHFNIIVPLLPRYRKSIFLICSKTECNFFELRYGSGSELRTRGMSSTIQFKIFTPPVQNFIGYATDLQKYNRFVISAV